MSSRDENTSTGIAAALYGLAFLLALVGALFLPPGFISALFGSKWTFIAPLFAVVIGVPVLLRLAQRDRIRKAVEESGGRMLKLKRLPFWRQSGWPCSYIPAIYGYSSWRGVVYEVEFLDPLGVTHRAICRSGFLRGVQWLEEL
jgi:hypothetical protein